jgi:hypothetical protein
MTVAADTELADLMMKLVGLDLNSADGRARAGARNKPYLDLTPRA